MKDAKVNEICALIDKCLCPKLTNALVKGRIELVLQSPNLYVLNNLLVERTEDFHDLLLTASQRLKLEQFQKLLDKVSHLSVRQRSVDSFEKPVDLELFKKLKNLKTSHLDLSKLVPIGHLKSQLVSFNCRDCCRIEAMFSDKLQWAELTNLSLIHCKIERIDDSNYFKNAPWLQILNLSFCGLTHTKFLTNLDHLAYLDVSFNFLVEIPNLNPSARNKLKILIVSHNCLDSLTGLHNLPYLLGLDLTNNLIADKYSLIPLNNLERLSWIKLAQNPVSFIDYYRIYAASCIKTKTQPTEFRIDGVYLNKRELALFGSNFLQTEMALPTSTGNESSVAILDIPSTSTVSILDETFTGTPNSTRMGDSFSERRGKKSKSKMSHVRIPVIYDESTPIGNFATRDSMTEIENFDVSIPPLPLPPSSVSLSPTNHAKLLELDFSNSPDTTNDAQGSSSPIVIDSLGITNNERPISMSFPKTVLVEVHKAEVDLTPDEFPREDESLGKEPHSSEPSDLESIKIIDEDIPFTSNPSKESDGEQRKYPNIENQMDERHKSDVEFSSSSSSKLSINGDSLENEDKSLIDNPYERSIELFSPSNENDHSSDVTISTNLPSIEEQSNEILDRSGESSKDSDESCYSSDNDADEILWQVLRVDSASKKNIPIFLALLENELKERCPKSGETLSKWPLNTVLSCVKSKNDPITIEMEFDSVKKDKQNRTYIMEFADAQTLTKKIYRILESMPLKVQNQLPHLCLKCSSLFVHSRPDIKSKENRISCPMCGSTLITETEEPKMPDKPISENRNISHSPSQSSTTNVQNENVPGSSKQSTPAAGQCSVISTDPQRKYDYNALRKYESDVEVISSPSQSSIEVIDENSSRSQSVTPRRKKSEDCQPIPEMNLKSVLPPIAALTESSSSGSLTESVVTTYDAQSVIVNKNSFSSECLPEESCENSPINANKDVRAEDNSNSTNRHLQRLEVYSYSNYSDVDLRVHTYIYQKVFKQENETLLALVKCHIWKTGGSDYDGCFVLSSSSAYFLYHNYTDFSDQVCDWLSPNESYQIEDIRRVQPIIWFQGLEIQIKEFSFILLLMDTQRTENLLKHFTDEQLKHSSLKGIKIISKPDTKTETTLYEAAIASDLCHNADQHSAVVWMVICRSVEITKVDVSEEIFRLPSVVITLGVFLIIPGDLSWLCSSSRPTISLGRDLSTLMDVHKKGTALSFHFFNEVESVEETWLLKMATEEQSTAFVSLVAQLWEHLYSEKLDISISS